VLVVCGYSFGDAHINEVLLEGIQANPTAAIFALQFGDLARYPGAISLATNAGNFNVLATDEAIVGSMRGPWKRPQTSGLSVSDTACFWNPTGPIIDGLGGGEFLLGDFVKFGDFLTTLVPNTAGF
jgi:hypothetical protein